MKIKAINPNKLYSKFELDLGKEKKAFSKIFLAAVTKVFSK